MDVRKQGLTMLFLRLVNMSTADKRRKMDEYMNKWIDQVRFTDAAMKKAKRRPPSKRIPCR